MTVPAAEWRIRLELAKPAGSKVSPTLKAAGVAYSNSKLAILYYAHELQRRAPEGINVAVFEPGFMPGTGLSRQHSPGVQRMGRGMQRLPIPGITSPVKSGPALASVTLDERWAHLRDGDFVVNERNAPSCPSRTIPTGERRCGTRQPGFCDRQHKQTARVPLHSRLHHQRWQASRRVQPTARGGVGGLGRPGQHLC